MRLPEKGIHVCGHLPFGKNPKVIARKINDLHVISGGQKRTPAVAHCFWPL
jgi:hypothetical protein